MAKEKKDKKKTVDQMTVDELKTYIQNNPTDQFAKDKLDERVRTAEKEAKRKEKLDNGGTIEKFDAKKIPQYLNEAVKEIPNAIKETVSGLKEDLGYSIADNPEEYKEEVKEYNQKMGIEPTEEVTPSVTTPEVENVPVDWKDVIINQNNGTREKGQKTTPKKNIADYTQDALKWAGAVGDTIASSYKQKANTAHSLAGYGGQFAPSSAKPYSEEETTSPFQKIRSQAYENVTSKMKAEQEAQNKATQTAIDNLNKEVYDEAAKYAAGRQAEVNETLGKVSNKLHIDLQKSVYDLKKGELDKFIKEMESDLGSLPPKIKEIASVLMKGNLESSILSADVNVVGSGIKTAGDLLSKLVGAAF